jgi:protein phosphatase
MAQAQDTGLSIRFAEKAHIGRRKKEQQDYHGHVIIPADQSQNRPAIYLFVVGDGVSMGTAGALASKTGVETMLNRFEELVKAGATDLADTLNQAFNAAVDEVAELAQDRPGMATTCAAALLVGDRLVTAHVGDSRIYLARPASPATKNQPQFKVIGVDHSWVEEVGRQLVQNGEMAEQELLTDPRRHTITRALGMEGEVLADYNTAQLQPGDLILLCSDGLWDLIEPNLLQDFVVSAATDLTGLKAEAAQQRIEALGGRLEEAALAAGGRDNITLGLLLIERVGYAPVMPALPRLLAQTAHELEERTGYAAQAAPRLEAIPNPPTFRPYQPLNRTDTEQHNLEAIFSKAQKLFALGHWDESLEEFLQIEKTEPSYRNLYEVLSNNLIRYIEGAMARRQTERVQYLFSQLARANVIRYNDVLADFCLEESRKSVQSRDYQQAKIYADFVLQLRAGDVSARSLLELCELYLELSYPGKPLGDRLALAQKIYGRDADFGSIQDDLASIYMELGDEASRANEHNDALYWYQMIRPLRPSDPRMVSLALSKQRAIEDTMARHDSSQRLRAEMTGRAGVERSAGAKPGTTELELGGDNRAENDMINRLRERVSRAQKAWDAGRKEVGAEYIYLVEQLSNSISPNPWQPTFPRVCYDYGKWLLEQKQYAEARPYFQKAQNLGMAAAQQRLSEIDRALREQAAGPRGASPVDLPDPQPEEWRSGTSRLRAYEQERQIKESYQPRPLLSDAAQAPNTRQPLIQRRVEVPVDAKFVGTSHAGDGVLGPEDQERPPTPLTAAAIAAGNVGPEATNTVNLEKPEKLVGSSGTLRHRDTSVDPLHYAASREAGRLQNVGLPQSVAQRDLVRRRQTEGFLSLVGGLTPLATMAIVGVVLVVAIILALNIFGNLTKSTTQDNTAAITAAVPVITATPAITTGPTATTALTGPARLTSRVDGMAASDVRVFLVAPGDTPANYREFNLEAGDNFRLPQSVTDQLDPKVKYTILVRPKDKPDRKYQADLALDAPLQSLWSKTDLNITSVTDADLTLKIPAEAIYFYPLDNGDQDLDLPNNGGRYIKATRHIVKPEFLKYYNDNGGLNRLGFPISEEFNWKDVGLVQFFERGWLVRSGDSPLVRLGKLGQTVLDDPNFDSALKPAPGVGTASYKVDAAFSSVANDNNRYGKPLSAAFEISSGNTKKKVQYFEFARLETDPAQKSGPISLGLLGTEYARARNWTR